jgi:hypothetical protein
MEPTPLNCPKCGASWKLVKAGKGPITCPKCKAVLGGPTVAAPMAGAVPSVVTLPPASPVATISDIDDPGLRGGFITRPPEPVEPRRRTTNPLLRVIVILLLLLVLVPLAVIVLFVVVCAFMVSTR